MRIIYFYICRRCKKAIAIQGISNIKKSKTGLCSKCSHLQRSKNSQWKSNNVKYRGLHKWIERHKPKPKVCEICRQKEPYDLANISGEYKRDINDFQWLCRSCHMKLDGRINNLIKGDNNRKRNKRGRYK